MMNAISQAMQLHSQGRLDEAERGYLAVLAIEPQNFDALNMMGVVKLQRQAPAEAYELFQQAIALRPQSVDALSNLAFVLLTLNRPAEALAVCDQALRIASNPKIWATRGQALARAQNYAEALDSFDAALKIAPNDIEALIGRGTALACLDRRDEATETFNRLPTGHDPNSLYNRASLQQSLGLLDVAVRDYRRLTEIVPNALAAWLGLLVCACELCDWPAQAMPRKKAIDAVAAGLLVDPVLVTRLGSDSSQQLKCAQAFARNIPSFPRFSASAASRPARLRIAYLSPDFRVHPLAYLIAELLERHDRSRFEVIGVSFGPPDSSEIRARIVRAFDQFHELPPSVDDQAAALLRKLNIDIAVDLAVYTQHSRPGVVAKRVAPIQVSYLGYCGTSGGSFIDYLLADKTVISPEQRRFFTEKIAYLPGSFMVADSTQPISKTTPSRREYGLPDNGFVFCCFNKNYKITETLFDIWMRILRSVNGSVLWLSANQNYASSNLLRAAAARHVDPRRLVFAPIVASRPDHFARYRLADLFLDTLPYNAHTTACDALFCGLPVLTTTGSTFVGRVAASMLRALGLDELVTDNLQEYETMAVALAGDSARLLSIRGRLATNRNTHPLFDTDLTCRHIERAYDRMDAIHRRGEPPTDFECNN